MINTNLVENLTDSGVLKTPEIIEAFKKVDRADFVLPSYFPVAYEDMPLPLGYGVTISQPTTVAFMLELLAPKKGEKILDIGFGSGWTTALLAEIVGDDGAVFSTEIVPPVFDFGQQNLQQYNYLNVFLFRAKSGHLGLLSEAPFDKILVSASADRLPFVLIDQLKDRGDLVIPILESIFKISRISKEKQVKTEYKGFVFVPLR